MSITEANRTGLSGLVSSAEAGDDIALSRRGKIVAEVVGTEELADLRRDRETLRDVALVMTRMATDTGHRTDLDAAMSAFGIDRADLEAEIAAGLHSLS